MGGRAFLETSCAHDPGTVPGCPWCWAPPAPRSWTAYDRAYDAWSRPIRGPLDRIGKTTETPIGALTVPELFDWAIVLGYSALTGYVIGKAAGNIAVIALGGPRRS